MKTNRWLKWIFASAAVVAVIAMVAVTGVSLAQAATKAVGPNPIAHPGFGGGNVDMQALLAEELGISVEELEAAKQAAFEAAIEIMVDEGVLTQEQADQLQSGELGRGSHFGQGRGHGHGGFRGGRFSDPPTDSAPTNA